MPQCLLRALFKIANERKQPTCLLTVNGESILHVIQKSEILSPVTITDRNGDLYIK